MALRCPKLFYYRYVEKLPEPEVNPAARIGKAIHRALELSLGGKALAEALAEGRKVVEGDDEAERYDTLGTAVEPFLRRIADFRRDRSVARQYVEYPLAIREDLSATKFYAGDALYRGIIDVAYLYDGDRLAVVDHKSGVRRGAGAVSDQLEGYAVLATAQFRNIRHVWLGIHWVADAAMQWAEPTGLNDVGSRFVPGVLDNIEAAALAVADGPRPMPGHACTYCAYRSVCPSAHDVDVEDELDVMHSDGADSE